MQETLTHETFHEPKPRRWPVVVDALFYLVLILAVVGFGYYIYYYLSTPLIASLFSKDKIAMVTWIPVLLQKTGITIIISLVSMVLATIFGLFGAFGRLARFAPVRWLATIYVEVIRGTPVLVQLLLWYFGIAQALSLVGFDPYTLVFNLATALQSNSLVPDSTFFDPMFWGIIGLSFNYGAYLTEVFRTGIESVDRGQTEASLSLGLNSSQTMRHIILPQALRITLPPFTNYFITLVQDSALLSLLGLTELEQQIGAFASPQNNSGIKLFIYIFGALFYLVICYVLSLLARFLEARFAKAY